MIWWIVLLAYNKKTIHEGTRTITKKHEEESLQTLMLDFCSILAKDLLTFSLSDIVRIVLRRLETQESSISDTGESRVWAGGCLFGLDSCANEHGGVTSARLATESLNPRQFLPYMY